MSSSHTSFSSQSHGFRFVNRFDLLPPIALPAGRRIDLGDWIIGLCGGMCYAALDYFYAGRPIPEVQNAEDLDDRLRHYLQRRQRNSVPLRAFQKLAVWILKSDSEVMNRTLGREYPKLRFLIDNGQPAVLILVRTQGREDPTRNHQVVATGYTDDSAVHQVRISLYDPNHPGQEPYLLLDYADPSHVHLSQSTGEALRGFFVTDYKPRKTEA